MTTLIGVKDFCEKNPETVAKFLRMYIRVQQHMRKQGDKMVPELVEFYKEWAGYDMSPEFAKLELELRPMYTLEEQLDALKGSPFNSKADKWQESLAISLRPSESLNPKSVIKCRKHRMSQINI